MKGILGVLLGIWLCGAAVLAFGYEFERRADCVKQEGFLKGLLWCETDPTSHAEVNVSYMSMFIKGLGWPGRFFNRDENTDLLLVADANAKDLTQSSAEEKKAALERFIRECGFDKGNPSQEAKTCVMNKMNAAYGASNMREGYCIRQANTFREFAQARDRGGKLSDGLRYLDTQSQRIFSEMERTTGQRLDTKKMVDETKEVLRYVYRHPEMSPLMLYEHQLKECMARS